MTTRSRIRVLHCPTMTGGNPQGLALAERKLGLDSRAVVFEQTWFDFATDEIMFDPSDSFFRRERARFLLLKRVLVNFDVVHFNFGQSILFHAPDSAPKSDTSRWERLRENLEAKYHRLIHLKDLPLLKRMGKGIVVTYQGDDARQQDFCLENFEITHAREAEPGHFTPETDALKRAQISIFDTYADSIYALNPDLLWVLPNRTRFMPYASVDPRQWEVQPPNPIDRLPVILHAPSDRAIKGTKYVQNAVSRLRAEGYQFEFHLVHGLPHREARRLYEKADLLVDQVLAGWYGSAAVELMAMGKPVACYLRESDFQFIPEQMRRELPLINARPDTIYDVLRQWITTRRAEIPALGQRSRAFVERWHDPIRIAANLAEDYEAIAERIHSTPIITRLFAPARRERRDDPRKTAESHVPQWDREVSVQIESSDGSKGAKNFETPRILVVSHLYPHEHNPVSGIFVHEQVKALRKRGVDARVVSGRQRWLSLRSPRTSFHRLKAFLGASFEDWEHWDGVPVFYFPFLSGAFIRPSALPLSYRLGLRRHLRKIREIFPFEAIHAHTAFLDGRAAADLAVDLKTPIVLTEHTGPFSTITRTSAIRRQTEAALMAADRILAVSSSLRDDMAQRVNPNIAKRIEVLPNGVDLELFHLGEQRPSDGVIRALWIGHCEPVKRVDRLIAAFGMAVSWEPGLRLSLVGPGIPATKARALARSAGVEDRVTLEEGLDRHALAQRISQCDFVVISSDTETFSMVAIEAIACGKPVLATDCGGPSDLVTAPELGLIVERGEWALAKGMVAMAQRASTYDPARIREHAQHRFSIESIAEKLEAAYRELIEFR